MSKNMTRKGLAFGVTLALGASLIATAPAVAIGEDGNVRLSPNVGEDYNVRASDYFDLKANWSDSVEGTGNWMKYLVEAGSGAFKFDLDTNPADTDEIYTVTNGVGRVIAASGATVTITTGSDTTIGLASHGLAVGDTVRFGGFADSGGTGGGAAMNTFHVVKTAATNSFTIELDTSTNGAAADGNETITLATRNDGTDVTIFTAAAHSFQQGDEVTIAGMQATLDGTEAIKSVGTDFIVVTETVAATTVLADGAETLTSVQTDGLATAAAIRARGIGSYNIVAGRDASVSLPVTDTRAVANSFNYIIDSNDADNTGADHVLRIVATSTSVTTAVKVTAWIDKNDNDLIDSDESKSPVRTINFLRAADITATTTIRPATVGDSTVTADVTFTPTLNGNMIIANEGLTLTTVTNSIARVDFTRQGDSTAVTGNTNGSYNATTKVWSFPSVDFATGNGWTQTNNSKVSLGAAGSATVTVWKYKIVKNVVTITTGSYASSKWSAAAHGLRVGDTITVTDGSISDRWEKSAAVITSVPTTSSFTFTETGTSTTDVAEVTVADTTGTSTFGLTSPVYLRDKVEAGTITAQFYFDSSGASNVSGTPTTAQTIAPLASYVVGAKVVGASGIAVAGTPSATVSAAGSVLRGTTTASGVVTVTDTDGDPVGAGVDVVLTATKSSSGTVKLNGTTVTTSTAVYAKTDAAGKVALSIENSAAALNDTLAITAASQGASGSLTFTWQDREYTVHDLADTTAANDARSRVVASGASYTFRFLVQDQFKAAPGADIRLLVTATGRTEFQNIVPLTSGQATVVVADGGLGTGLVTNVRVAFQKRTGTVWATQSGTDEFQDWDAASAEQDDLAQVVINYDSSADNLTLNANGANFPGNGTADNAASVATKALKAIDLRNTAGTAGEYTAAETGTVSGRVTNAFGVAKPGAVVTVSGTGLLFNSGDVWALNSVTLLANSSGQFSVNVFSSTGGAKVVTATVGSVSRTFTITYTGVTGDAKLTITAPDSVRPASTFQVKAKIADALGNGVDTAAGGVKVTYSGPGIVFGNLPDQTDATGDLQFSVLLGSNDTGNVVVTVSYDQNADGDYIDAKDQTVSKTIVVGSGAASGTGKVNVGSFNGKLVVYAAGLNGKRISWKVGGNWGSAVAASNYAIFNRPTPRAGVTVTVDIYVNGVKTLTKSVVTR